MGLPWSQQRAPYQSRDITTPSPVPRYVELHCHSNFSFLDGVSHPEQLIETAAALGYLGIALTDHNGMYGAVRFAEAARSYPINTIFGAEISIGDTASRVGAADPVGQHLVILARSPEGYTRLSTAIGNANLRGGEKNRTIHSLSDLAELSAQQHFAVLTGCRKGVIPHALREKGLEGARREADALIDTFGNDNVFIEMWHHHNPTDDARNTALASLSNITGLPLVATGNVHFATPSQRHLAGIVAAIRAQRSLDDIDGWLPALANSYLHTPNYIYRRFRRYPDALGNAVRLGTICAFDFTLITPNLPDCSVPTGHNEMSWLRHLVSIGAKDRYGSPQSERVDGAYAQLDYELRLIEQLGFPGYFLIVADIVAFCRSNDIYCQGRGSAANSAVCYALGITNVDAVSLKLLFERFLSPERDGPPDIDLDIESDRREEVIQYVYQRYGRENAAQVCNVISYRARSAVRDVTRAFGFSTGQQDAWSKRLDSWAQLTEQEITGVPHHVVDFATQLQGFPRHLGIHSGGMVLCDRPIVSVCPTEWARMPGRSVLQWDKDDCARAGLVKFDLLGLGMLSMLHYATDFIRNYDNPSFDIAQLPQDDAVYDMLCLGDSMGVFQVESRAQMATLPRLQPRTFYDLVIEIALIRPGPIQGGSVHPYLRRRSGKEPITYLHPKVIPTLEKTLGVPLFQEQLMQIAIDVAGFSPSESDQLRVAMGSKRSRERMEVLRTRLHKGMAENGIDPDTATQLYEKLEAFANYGFPESHAVSFAYLVYASAWIKRFYPQCFLAALLNAQPMGFWSPRSLIADAERHGVTVHGPDVNHSKACASIQSDGSVRLGLSSVRGIGPLLANDIANSGPYRCMDDLARAVPLTREQLETLAVVGAFSSCGISRREALWSAGAVSQAGQGRLPGIVTGLHSPTLPSMSAYEEVIAELIHLGASPGRSVMSFFRDALHGCSVTQNSDLVHTSHGTSVRVAGIVTHRQRPATAHGITFINLEDETGLVNVVCSFGFWKRYRRIASHEPAVLVYGKLEREGMVVNVIAEHIEPLRVNGITEEHLYSRDFH